METSVASPEPRHLEQSTQPLPALTCELPGQRALTLAALNCHSDHATKRNAPTSRPPPSSTVLRLPEPWELLWNGSHCCDRLDGRLVLYALQPSCLALLLRRLVLSRHRSTLLTRQAKAYIFAPNQTRRARDSAGCQKGRALITTALRGARTSTVCRSGLTLTTAASQVTMPRTTTTVAITRTRN
jgi:hypothetical protein